MQQDIDIYHSHPHVSAGGFRTKISPKKSRLRSLQVPRSGSDCWRCRVKAVAPSM